MINVENLRERGKEGGKEGQNEILPHLKMVIMVNVEICDGQREERRVRMTG